MQEDIVNRARRWARITAAEALDGVLRPEETLWWDLADEIERLRGRVAELEGRSATGK